MAKRVKLPRGRPPAKQKSERINIRLSRMAAEAYDTKSALTKIAVATLIRRVAEQHAPVIVRAPRIPEHP